MAGEDSRGAPGNRKPLVATAKARQTPAAALTTHRQLPPVTLGKARVPVSWLVSSALALKSAQNSFAGLKAGVGAASLSALRSLLFGRMNPRK